MKRHSSSKELSSDVTGAIIDVRSCIVCGSTNITSAPIARTSEETEQKVRVNGGMVGFCNDCNNGFKIEVAIEMTST